ncbi:P-loop NTPase fold protein [Aquisalibacillus elongatus]|uniref:KAP-like P-loop domain-containing protein n=1 Tax=Aquisalibacillus elongatus TaxID=485577 RepID=A0A3N5BAK1_9BACI|nr:P-loop NTPase fold protein [Aquisalibacillus elongatus]RPF54423.1 KAP-like P-loop domain-containing protein [Aquisalibacillus elongatus]
MEEVTQAILKYIDQDKPDYAIMINGPWGSGKTYFWRNIVRPAIAEKKNENKSLKVIYTSLYGLKSVDELGKKIFYEFYANSIKSNSNIKKITDNKFVGAIPEMGKILLNIGSGFGVSFGNKSVEYENLFDLENCVLCFDDLERTDIELTEILGYINNFVEHDNIHTIIICNEDEIEGKNHSINYEQKVQAAASLVGNSINNIEEKVDFINNNLTSLFDTMNDYKRIKEKLVGRTITFVPNYEEIIRNVVTNSASSSDINQYLNDKIELIIRVFNQSKTNNVRILKQALVDFSSIYEETKVDSELKCLQEKMLVLTLILSFEIKSGNIDKSTLKKIETTKNLSSLSLQFYIKDKGNDTAKNRLLEMIQKYKLTYLKNIPFLKFIERLICDGIIDGNLLLHDKQVICKSERELESFEHLLNGYWDLTDNEFQKNLSDTLYKLSNNEIPFYLYHKIYTILRNLSENQLIENFEEVVNQIKKNLQKDLDNIKGSYQDDISMKLDIFNNYPNDSDLNEIKELILEINNDIRNEEDIEVLENLIKNTISLEEFIQEVDKKFGLKPIFDKIDLQLLIKTLNKMENSDLVSFNTLLKNRYASQHDELKTDYPYLKELKNLIKKNCLSESLKLSDVIFKQIISNIDNIVTKQS